jgi:hypothetical protein
MLGISTADASSAQAGNSTSDLKAHYVGKSWESPVDPDLKALGWKDVTPSNADPGVAIYQRGMHKIEVVYFPTGPGTVRDIREVH